LPGSFGGGGNPGTPAKAGEEGISERKKSR